MMELLHTRHEQESMHRDLAAALTAIHELPSVIARKGEGAAAMWGPDGGDLFEQVGRGRWRDTSRWWRQMQDQNPLSGRDG